MYFFLNDKVLRRQAQRHVKMNDFTSGQIFFFCNTDFMAHVPNTSGQHTCLTLARHYNK